MKGLSKYGIYGKARKHFKRSIFEPIKLREMNYSCDLKFTIFKV
jgi:hypothetical protein